jgi:hypothetical protein
MAREENRMANTLVKQASGYEVSMGIFFIKDRPMMQSTVACIDESVEGKLDHGEGNVSNESTTPRAANGESVANAGTIKGAFSADKGKTDQRKSVMSRAEGRVLDSKLGKGQSQKGMWLAQGMMERIWTGRKLY